MQAHLKAMQQAASNPWLVRLVCRHMQPCHLELGRRALLKEHPRDRDSDQPGPCQLRLNDLARAAASGCLQQTAAGHQGLLQVF